MSIDLLLDTHVVLWLALGDPRGRAVVGDAWEDPASTVTVSAASYMEIAIKFGLGKLPTDVASVRRQVRRAQLLELSMTPSHAEALEMLTRHHGDPFDRMLIAQALSEDMTIATVDKAFLDYEGLAVMGVS